MIRRTSLAALLLLTSCSIAQPIKSSPVLPRIIKNTPREIAITKTVGDVMVEFGEVKVFPAFVATEDFNLPIKTIGKPSARNSKGTKWMCTRYILTDHYWCSTFEEPPELPENFDLAADRSGVIVGFFALDGGFIKFDKTIDGKLLPMDMVSKGSYKQELIYNGKSKDTIIVSYREYVDDMARPSFYQNLTYDLLESREIAFRDLRIEVLEATNSAIKFIVK